MLPVTSHAAPHTMSTAALRGRHPRHTPFQHSPRPEHGSCEAEGDAEAAAAEGSAGPIGHGTRQSADAKAASQRSHAAPVQCPTLLLYAHVHCPLAASHVPCPLHAATIADIVSAAVSFARTTPGHSPAHRAPK